MIPLQIAIDARAARREAQSYIDATGRMRKANGQFAKSAEQVDLSLQRGAKSALRAARSIAAVQVALNAIARITGGIGDAVDTIARFEETMATVASVSGATASEFERLTDTAKNLGATTRFSATEAGEGLLFLSRAGFTASESIQALPSTLDLAAAGGLELGRAADFASNILSQFGLSADQTTRVVDVLINTSNRANTDVRQLAEAMKFAGPVAGSLGISAEATAAALGALGDSGLQSGIAGRNLRQVFLKLVNTTNEGREVFDRLGISLESVNPQTNSLATIFERLRRSGLTAADAAKIFGAESAGAALILSNSTKKLIELNEANLNAAGTARQVAEAMDNTLAGAIRSLKSSIEAVIIATGDAGLKGSLRAVIETVTGAIRILNGMESEVDQNMMAARRLAMIIENLGFLIAGFVTAKTLVTIATFSNGLLTAATSAKALTAALATNPIGLVTVALSLGVAALIKYRNEVVQIGDTTTTVGKIAVAAFNVVRSRAMVVAKNISLLFSASLEAIVDNFSKAKNFIIGVFRNVKMNIDSFLEALGTNFNSLFSSLIEGWKSYGNFVIKLIRGIIASVSTQIEAIRKAVVSVANINLSDPLQSSRDIAKALNNAINIQKVAKRSFTAFKSELTSNTDFIGGAVDLGAEYANSFAKGFKEIVDSPGFKAGIASLRDTFGFESFVDDFNRELNRLSSITERAFFGIGDQARKAFDVVGQGIQNAINAKKFLDQGLTASQSAFSSVSPSSIDAGNASAGSTVKIPEAAQTIQAFQDIENPFAETAEGALEAAQNIFSLQSVSEDISSAFANNFSIAFDQVVQGTATIKEAFQQLGRAIIQEVIKQIAVKSTLLLIETALAIVTGGGSTAAGGATTGPLSFLGGLFGGANANGNAFYRGSVMPFADGGIFNSPILFPMARGKVGLMGEAGPEAILPLARNGRGQLGVRAEGSGQRGPQQIIQQTINFNVSSPNADSFRSSERQIKDRLLGEIGF